MASQPIPHRKVPVRKVRFATGGLPRHFADGDLVMSHIVGVLSAVFPPGEEFFIRSVRNYRDRITDPELSRQIRGFIGQEMIHGREHDRLNDDLHEMGYPVRRIHRFIDWALKLAERTTPQLVCLGYTAALEHYTATIAEVLLTDERAQALLGENEVRSILLWHALEESEHKAVAFDVYRAVGGTERMRIWTMRFMSTCLLLVVIIGSARSAFRDPASRNLVRVFRSLAALRHSPFLTRKVVRRLRAYNRPGFHPDDFDNAELMERWRAELFGSDGRLSEKLKYAT